MGNSINTLPLSDWRDFYVLVGTAAGVIVGATFVVASLVNNVENRSIGMRGFITRRWFIWAACWSGVQS